MKYKILSNPRVEANDFRMKHGCSFCPSFNSKVLEFPGTTLLICKGCLHKMMLALDVAMMEDIKKGERL